MAKPVTPLVGIDTFVMNENNEVCLIQRADNGMWAMPGGCHDLGETPKQCAEREFLEETGLQIEVTRLLGVFSSLMYEYDNYPYKENEFCHLLFQGSLLGGLERTCEETMALGWFTQGDLPELSDGYVHRIEFGFKSFQNSTKDAHYE